MVVDEHPELVDDRFADLADVVQAVELAGEALSIFRCAMERTSRPEASQAGALAGLLVEEDGLVLAARLRGHHGYLCAGDQLAGVHGVLRPLGDADGDAEPAGRLDLGLSEAVHDPAGERARRRRRTSP